MFHKSAMNWSYCCFHDEAYASLGRKMANGMLVEEEFIFLTCLEHVGTVADTYINSLAACFNASFSNGSEVTGAAKPSLRSFSSPPIPLKQPGNPSEALGGTGSCRP
jgi:hypothetical protein